MEEYDLAVIGSGPGGYVCAIRASQLGLKTVLIEKNELGGVCTNWGCIPTKALLESAHFFHKTKNDKLGLVFDSPPRPDIEKIVERSRSVVKKLSAGIGFLLKKYKVDYLENTAVFEGKNELALLGVDGRLEKNIRSKSICIATGARAKKIPGVEYGKRILTFKEILLLKEIPSSLLVIGAGAIGCEFADYFQCLGTKVTLVEALPNLLPAEESFLGNELKSAFEKKGMRVLVNAKVSETLASEKKVKVAFANDKQSYQEEFDYVLVAIGITPNLESLQLEKAGISYEKGLLAVDDFQKIIGSENLYAIGDVVRGKQLAHKASHEGIMVAEAVAGKQIHSYSQRDVPSCIYTQPQIASVGYSAKELEENKIPFKKGNFPYSALGRALAADAIRGSFTVYLGEENGEILGAHFVGENVTDLISHIALARNSELIKEDFHQTIFPHPTFAEGIHEAIAVAFGESCNF